MLANSTEPGVLQCIAHRRRRGIETVLSAVEIECVNELGEEKLLSGGKRDLALLCRNSMSHDRKRTESKSEARLNCALYLSSGHDEKTTDGAKTKEGKDHHFRTNKGDDPEIFAESISRAIPPKVGPQCHWICVRQGGSRNSRTFDRANRGVLSSDTAGYFAINTRMSTWDTYAASQGTSKYG